MALIALSIAIVVPRGQVDLDPGVMQAITILLEGIDAGWLVAFARFTIALGMLGEVNNWIPALARGLLVAGRDGALPNFLQRAKRVSAHYSILLFQAVIGLGFALFSTLPFVLYSLCQPEWRSSLDPKT